MFLLSEFKAEPRQIIEVPKRFCTHPACHSQECPVQDAYLLQQRTRGPKVIRSLNSFLDEDYLGQSRSKQAAEQFKKELRHQDMLALLPAAVPAYSLRNRKWGKLMFKNSG